MIREAALRHDMFATFMAKPIEGEPGSAMHIHHSVLDMATGQNLFSTDAGRQHRHIPAFHWRLAAAPAPCCRVDRALCKQLPPLRPRFRGPHQSGMGA